MQYQQIIAQLKADSSYYPQVLIRSYENSGHTPVGDPALFASSLVRIFRGGRWLVVHCVETIIQTPAVSKADLLLRFMNSVHKIQHLYVSNGKFEDVDSLQISERERLTRLLTQA